MLVNDLFLTPLKVVTLFASAVPPIAQLRLRGAREKGESFRTRDFPAGIVRKDGSTGKVVHHFNPYARLSALPASFGITGMISGSPEHPEF